MAELIDKGALIKDWKKLPVQKVELVSCDDIYRNRPLVDLARVYEMIESAPTTTEAEIRAKAIDEFAEKLLEEVEANPVDVGGRYSYMIPQSFLEGQIKDIAEQLKEE